MNEEGVEQDFVFTVFTPTFNRARTLERVFQSLCSQTYRNFEWLVVDDGSEDETASIVRTWAQHSPFPTRYYYQENRGKHVAFNRAVQLARGELFLTLDSDDAALPEALEILRTAWLSIPEQERHLYSAVTGLCRDKEGNVIGTKFPCDEFDSNSSEIRYRYRVKGEKWGFQRTDVLRKYPFPELDSMKFVPEGIVWAAIGAKFKTRYINRVVRTYYVDESTVNQLSTGADPARHAAGHALWHREVLNFEIGYFRYAPLEFFRSAVHYGRFSLHSGKSFWCQFRQLKGWLSRVLFSVGIPVALAMYLIDSRRSNRD